MEIIRGISSHTMTTGLAKRWEELMSSGSAEAGLILFSSLTAVQDDFPDAQTGFQNDLENCPSRQRLPGARSQEGTTEYWSRDAKIAVQAERAAYHTSTSYNTTAIGQGEQQADSQATYALSEIQLSLARGGGEGHC
jgi:hypothetical protein